MDEDAAAKRHEVVMAAFEEVVKRLVALEAQIKTLKAEVYGAVRTQGQGKSPYDRR